MKRPTAEQPTGTETGPVASVRPKRRIVAKRPTGGSMLMLIALIVGVMILAPTVQRVISQRQEIAQIERDIQQANEDINRIKADNARWNDPAYVRAEARGRLLFVQPGDTTYVVIDSSRSKQVDVPADLSAEVHETKADPVALYVDSLIGADTAGAPHEPIDGKTDPNASTGPQGDQ